MLKDLMKVCVDGESDGGEADYYGSLQRVINDGSIWRMEGSSGRGAMACIESGSVMCGRVARSDYWGNRVPARSELKAGTKGTREYVVARHGEEWASMLEAKEIE